MINMIAVTRAGKKVLISCDDISYIEESDTGKINIILKTDLFIIETDHTVGEILMVLLASNKST